MKAATIEQKFMDNPMATDGLVAHKPEAAKQWATVNLNSRIGGLAYIRAYNPKTGKGRRMPHHERTAERFLNLYEARYGRCSPAVDPSREPVDTSLTANDGGLAAALDATREIQEVEQGIKVNGILVRQPVLGADGFRCLVAIICLGLSVSELTETQGRALDKQVGNFLALLDKLSEHWGLSMEAA